MKNPKIFQKPQNLGFKTWNAQILRDKKLTKWGKFWKSLKKPWGLRLEWDESVWERKKESYRERDRKKWVADRMRRLYRLSVNLNRCRCRKVLRQLSRKVSRKWSLTDIGVEEQSIRFKNISSIYPLAVEKLSRRQELSRSIHQVSRSCRDCDMKKLKELDR